MRAVFISAKVYFWAVNKNVSRVESELIFGQIIKCQNVFQVPSKPGYKVFKVFSDCLAERRKDF